MTTVILFVFGAIVGSFLNVVGLRFNSGLSLGGRSGCPACGASLKWFELIPILSFLILYGRCRSCKAKISMQYPLVELWTGLIFVTVPEIFLPVFCLYVAITVYDARHKVIPDLLVYSAITLSFIYVLFNLQTYKLIDFAAGPILFSLLAAIWLVTRGKAIGFGDAKLALSIGLLLGAASGFSALIVAVWLGAAFGIVRLALKNITMKSEIPFAPLLILGAWISLVFNLDLLHVSIF